jgi:hypothetical protein
MNNMPVMFYPLLFVLVYAAMTVTTGIYVKRNEKHNNKRTNYVNEINNIDKLMNNEHKPIQELEMVNALSGYDIKYRIVRPDSDCND